MGPWRRMGYVRYLILQEADSEVCLRDPWSPEEPSTQSCKRLESISSNHVHNSQDGNQARPKTDRASRPAIKGLIDEIPESPGSRFQPSLDRLLNDRSKKSHLCERRLMHPNKLTSCKRLHFFRSSQKARI